MTEEFKVILDGYLQWCRENNQEPCVIDTIDVSGMRAGKQCGMLSIIHTPDLEQDAPRNATEAEREYFNALLRTSEYIAKATGTDEGTVFRALLESISNSPVIYPFDINQKSYLTADDVMQDGAIIPVLPRGSMGARYLDPFKLAIINIPHCNDSQ